ncbi:hypothetical protein CANINC_001967 [Pichia inconspicua]|uniref:RRM domain-containing protein n=1 Tax=Pichia inconspicua TaxID=52247 RepID=A0A4T0X2G3_9ASCO|nr:hypothetical protein CANINC_001967 [[Candida] inconspicua]
MDVGVESTEMDTKNLYAQTRNASHETNEFIWGHDLGRSRSRSRSKSRSRSASPNYRRNSVDRYEDRVDLNKRRRVSNCLRGSGKGDEFEHNDIRNSRSVLRDNVPKATLYVTGFVKGTTARRLAEVFEQFGPLAQVSVLPPRRHDGEQYAFVAFRRIADMEKVLDNVNQGNILDDGLAIDAIKGIDCQRAKRLPVSKRPQVSQLPSRDSRPRNRSRQDRGLRRTRDYRDRDPRDNRTEQNYSREYYHSNDVDTPSTLSPPLPPPQ